MKHRTLLSALPALSPCLPAQAAAPGLAALERRVQGRLGFFAVDTAPEGGRSPATYFGGARVGKRYVSYYLMPLYSDPSLGDDLSAALRKRRQGKSCFNLSTVDDALLAELEQLTARAFAATAGDPSWRPPATSRR